VLGFHGLLSLCCCPPVASLHDTCVNFNCPRQANLTYGLPGPCVSVALRVLLVQMEDGVWADIPKVRR
jgi:hypothetical protein